MQKISPRIAEISTKVAECYVYVYPVLIGVFCVLGYTASLLHVRLFGTAYND